MDVLSDVIAVMRTGRPRSARVCWVAPFGQRFAPVPGSSGFQVVLQGACWLRRPDHEPLLLTAGDVAFFAGGHEHALADSPTAELSTEACDPDDPAFAGLHTNAGQGAGEPAAITLCGAYRLDPARAHPLLRDLPELIRLPTAPGLRPELRAAVDLLGGEVARPRLGADAVVPALLDTLLLFILRAWFEESGRGAAATGWAAALTDPHVAAALHAVHRDPAQPWTVAMLAAEASLSRAPFARRFAALVGQPPLSYLTWWRMTTAARLLRESDAPLGSVANRVGYRSEFAFAAAFKRQFGLAPGRYRQACRA